MEMTKLPSVKRALKPLCWMVASECIQMYIRFLEDVIGGGSWVPQSFLRSGASLLGPSNTCYEKNKWSVWFQQEYWDNFYFFLSLLFLHFDPDAALAWAVQTDCTLPILSLWLFQKNTCIAGWSYCSLCDKNAPGNHLPVCTWYESNSPLTNQISPYVYCFLSMANMSSHVAFIQLNPAPCISKDH